jgi:solute carrier family 25 carnitine/acylcarnitine transporter 20/29
MMSSKLKNIIYPKPLPDINTINTINNTDTKDTTLKTKNNNSNNNNNSNYISKYINGGISGMCGIVLSHPIDTIKTHIQTGHNLNTFKPSFTHFYKGISAPLLGVGIEKAIVFGTYNYMYSKTENIPLSGALSGLTASLVVTPYERIKILKQNSEVIHFKELNIKFLFRGLSATFTREMPGFAIYFTTYEYLKKKTFTEHNKKIDYTSSFIYGGIAGITAWIFIYPQDRIKTILQSHSGTEKNMNLNIKSIMNSIYSNGGLKHFYTGFTWAVARASLLHSGTFCMMEYLNNKY